MEYRINRRTYYRKTFASVSKDKRMDKCTSI